jgi:hypothetical protein
MAHNFELQTITNSEERLERNRNEELKMNSLFAGELLYQTLCFLWAPALLGNLFSLLRE